MFWKDPDELPRFRELEAEYEILGELGRGSTAVVYVARERALNRKVAIKVIRATYIEDEEAAARLAREAQTIAGMQHPNIVVLYGTRRLRDRSLALFMQHVEGRTLKAEVQQNGALSFVRTEQILHDIGSALAYAHAHRIVHRDIKPENIYIDAETGIARLSDFGIARPWDAESGLTLPGSAIGTPTYMSPEQIDGAVLDGRSDLYSLGLVGYEMLTGVRPWAGETLFGVIFKQKHEELPSLALLRPGIPSNLREAIEGATRKDVRRRWQNADAFLRVLSGRPTIRRYEPATPAAPATPAPTDALATDDARAADDALAAHDALAYSDASAAPNTSADAAPLAAPGAQALPGTAAPFRADGDSAAPAHPGPAHPNAAVVKAPVQPTSTPVAIEPPVAAGHTIVFDRPLGSGSSETVTAERRAGEAGPRPIQAEPHTSEERRTQTTLPSGPAEPVLPGGRRRWRVAASVLMGVLVIGTGVTLAFSDVPRQRQGAAAGAPETVSSAGSTKAAGRAFAQQGDQQAGVAGDTLPIALVVRVEDARGRAIAGASVRFTVVTGAGAVNPPTAVTNDGGTVRARWVPQEPGAHLLEARVAGLAGPIVFHATALPRRAARMNAASATALRGSAGMPSKLAVKVVDDRGNPVPGVEIRFAVRTGDGRLIPAAPVTGTDGIAHAEWMLGTSRTQEAVATLPETPGATVVFSATAAPPPLPVHRTVAPGGTHTCVLAGDGSARCWGGNDSGQLGDGTASRRPNPVRVVAPEPFATIASGVGHSCAIGVSGNAFCWGANAAGQLGDGSHTSRTHPVRVNLDARLTTVAVGMSHSCALDTAGRLFCWGQNDHGQLGDGTRADRTAPVRAGGARTFRSVALGWAHTCALATDGTAYCWGRNGSGELGDGSTTNRAEAVRVTGGHRFRAIAAGSAHTCGLLADGTILCWGQNASGQLGNGSTTGSAVPVTVIGAPAFTALAAGGVHTCGLARDGAAHCWGRNTYGQLGDGTTADRPRAVPVETELRFSAIFASGAHTCATVRGGALYCWGFNLEGQVGDGTRTNQLRPVAVGRDN